MKVAYITPFVALAAAACVRKPDVGLWDVKTGEIFIDALYALKLRDYDEIERLNPGIDVNKIKPSQYTIPYVGDVDWPATWVTSSCTPTLILDGRAVSATPTADLDPTSTVPSIASTLLSTGSAQMKSSEATPSPTHIPKQESTTSPTDTHTSMSVDESPSATHTRQTTRTALRSPVSSPSKATPTILRSTFTTYSTPPADAFTTVLPTGGDEPREDSEYSLQFCRKDGVYFTLEDTHKQNAKDFCEQYSKHKMKEESDSITSLYEGDNDEIYQYSVSWIKGCTFHQQQDFTGCYDLMYNNFKDYNNGSKGSTKRKGYL